MDRRCPCAGAEHDTPIVRARTTSPRGQTRPKINGDNRQCHSGLIPAWADDPAIGDRLANARSETAATKPSFRRAFRSRRCLVVADGFYEWQKVDGRKQPYFIGLKSDRPFGLAGLWERWEKGEEPVE